MPQPDSGYRVYVGTDGLEPDRDADWTLTWTDRGAGVARPA